MQNVMQKAQELAEAILTSEVYTHMKELEEEAQNDPEASRAMEDMIAKRKKVEDILTTKNMDREELNRASKEMQQAEETMNQNGKILELKKARKDFSTMMDNVNRILRLIITGEIQDEDVGFSGCGGDCSGCSGCG